MKESTPPKLNIFVTSCGGIYRICNEIDEKTIAMMRRHEIVITSPKKFVYLVGNPKYPDGFIYSDLSHYLLVETDEDIADLGRHRFISAIHEVYLSSGGTLSYTEFEEECIRKRIFVKDQHYPLTLAMEGNRINYFGECEPSVYLVYLMGVDDNFISLMDLESLGEIDDSKEYKKIRRCIGEVAEKEYSFNYRAYLDDEEEEEGEEGEE